MQRTIEYGRQRYFLFLKKAVDFSFSTRFSRYRSGRGEMDFVQGEVHAKCTGGLVRCSPRHKMVIPRHVVFLAVGCGRRRAPARHCKSERHGSFALAMACWRATAFISRRKKVHMTRNDHVVPRRTTNKTLCALRPPSPSGKSIPPPLRTGIWKISLRKKSQPPPKSTLCIARVPTELL